MSDSKPIADHKSALDLYFNDMLIETTSDIVTTTAPTAIANAEPTIEYDKNTAFQALLFDINGLQLAIRSKDIKTILPWPETPLVHSPEIRNDEAVMGCFNLGSDKIKIINTAYIVLPSQHRQQIAVPSFIIVVGEGNWALSCHKINAVITLSPEDIHWRENKGHRPWLAGTSIEKKCSIVNLSGLVKLLNPQILA